MLKRLLFFHVFSSCYLSLDLEMVLELLMVRRDTLRLYCGLAVVVVGRYAAWLGPAAKSILWQSTREHGHSSPWPLVNSSGGGEGPVTFVNWRVGSRQGWMGWELAKRKQMHGTETLPMGWFCGATGAFLCRASRSR